MKNFAAASFILLLSVSSHARADEKKICKSLEDSKSPPHRMVFYFDRSAKDGLIVPTMATRMSSMDVIRKIEERCGHSFDEGKTYIHLFKEYPVRSKNEFFRVQEYVVGGINYQGCTAGINVWFRPDGSIHEIYGDITSNCSRRST